MNYSQLEKSRAEAWKKSTNDLPHDARAHAPYVGKDGIEGSTPYPFCLPVEFAEHNLLPNVRKHAVRIFRELGIPWHAGINDGPGNHLLSSQVQCANALTPMIDDPTRIVAAFGELLGIDEVLEIEPGRFLTFEYIGPTDFFGEAPTGDRVRGAHCTSVDAAFLHRAKDGVTELVLVEWKYTESYRVRRPDPAKDETRRGRYSHAVEDPNGPIRSGVLSFEHLLDEPFYQLMRQQLLAYALEQSAAEGAQRVRVVHVLPAGNTAYQQSLARPEHRALGATVGEVWQKLLRHTDRFLSLDSAVFLDPEITSPSYKARYGEGLVRNQIELVRGDIVEQQVDVVVTAANSGLRGGGGVDGAIHRAAGPDLFTACRALAPCLAGSSVITPAFGLTSAQWVVHSVGPRYRGPEDAGVLAAAYLSALDRADEVGATSIAFPSISTGVYGYPEDEAADVSVRALQSAVTSVERIVLVAYGERMHRAWARALGEDLSD